jgi:hypothetical protein
VQAHCALRSQDFDSSSFPTGTEQLDLEKYKAVAQKISQAFSELQIPLASAAQLQHNLEYLGVLPGMHAAQCSVPVAGSAHAVNVASDSVASAAGESHSAESRASSCDSMQTRVRPLLVQASVAGSGACLSVCSWRKLRLHACA